MDNEADGISCEEWEAGILATIFINKSESKKTINLNVTLNRREKI
jgi:hypothetical protein